MLGFQFIVNFFCLNIIYNKNTEWVGKSPKRGAILYSTYLFFYKSINLNFYLLLLNDLYLCI